MKSMTLQAAVFDMDGVLINSHPAHLAAWREFLRSEGVSFSSEDLAFILEGRTRSEILRRFLGDLSEQEIQSYGRRKDSIFRNLESEIALVPGVMRFLQRLEREGFAMAVATSASEIRTFATIERLGLSGYFDAIVTASDVSAGKPDPAVYRLACERLQIEAEQAIAFDDAPAGVQSARSAGMRCIGVTSNGRSEQLLRAGAEWVVPNFECAEFVAAGRAILGAGAVVEMDTFRKVG